VISLTRKYSASVPKCTAYTATAWTGNCVWGQCRRFYAAPAARTPQPNGVWWLHQGRPHCVDSAQATPSGFTLCPQREPRRLMREPSSRCISTVCPGNPSEVRPVAPLSIAYETPFCVLGGLFRHQMNRTQALHSFRYMHVSEIHADADWCVSHSAMLVMLHASFVARCVCCKSISVHSHKHAVNMYVEGRCVRNPRRLANTRHTGRVHLSITPSPNHSVSIVCLRRIWRAPQEYRTAYCRQGHLATFSRLRTHST
jgi:hypothetical protein